MKWSLSPQTPPNNYARWANHQTDASLCELQELGGQLGFEVAMENRVPLFRGIGIQTLVV